MADLLTIKQASEWATNYLDKNVTTSNISYLIQYGRIKKIGSNGTTQVSQRELINYYKSYNGRREISWKDTLGEDLNWALSFDQYKEAETTKHVHRLHPYKGKFIPQLVEYFLDSHTDNFKRKDEFEIGPLCKGQGREAKESYIAGIADVLNNCKKFLVADYDVFLVANDKYNLYPTITEKAGMKIVNQFKRPVLNRTEKDKGAYSETIFHLK